MSDEDIAKVINRTPERVARYRAEKQHSSKLEIFQEQGISNDLRKQYFWKELQYQLTKEELVKFEDRWVALISQFVDVKPTDAMQIVDYIRTEILIQRIYVREKDAIEEIAQIRKELEALEAFSRSDEEYDADKVIQLRSELASAITQQGIRDRDRKSLQKDKNDLFTQLNARRDQRRQELEQSKTTFWDLLRHLDDKEVREKEGHYMELIKTAVQKSEKDLSEYTTYDDGKIDRPLLNSDSILLDKEEDDDERRNAPVDARDGEG